MTLQQRKEITYDNIWTTIERLFTNALINGSPKGKNATSLKLLNGLRGYLEEKDGNEVLEIREYTWNNPKSREDDFDSVLECDAIVYAFPLYVDSIPGHLLSVLVELDKYIKNIRMDSSKGIKDIKVYSIVNNGFFDGKQNCLAIDNLDYWCKRVGFKLEQSIGLGGDRKSTRLNFSQR